MPRSSRANTSRSRWERARGYSAETSGFRKSEPYLSTLGGNTPTTVKGLSSMVRVRPRMLGSAPRCRCQYACDRTATRSPPGSNSSSRNPRPRMGWTPNAGNQPDVTNAPAIDSRVPSARRSSKPIPSSAATSSKMPRCARMSSKSAHAMLSDFSRGPFTEILTNRLGSRYGSGRKTTVSTTVKMAVFAPMPSASVTIATAEKTLFLTRSRQA